MTNLLNVLKTMETETTGVKNDVINFLLEDVKNYSPQAKLQDLLQHGCQSGMVNHLIYYKDTVAYFGEFEKEIYEFVSEVFGLDMYAGSEFIDALSEMFPVDSFYDRMDDYYEKAHQTITDEHMEDYDTVEELEEELEELIFDERYELATTLEDRDKNYLAWAIFEYVASVLYDELEEMGLIK